MTNYFLLSSSKGTQLECPHLLFDYVLKEPGIRRFSFVSLPASPGILQSLTALSTLLRVLLQIVIKEGNTGAIENKFRANLP